MSSSTADESRKNLAAWGKRRKTDNAARGHLILEALGNGITREEIHMLTGLGRTTIDRIAPPVKRKPAEDTGEES
jgi:hypothetical protein